MLPSLSIEQRQAIAQEGTPLPVIDADSGRAYLLLSVQFTPGFDGSVIASVPGFGLFGDADTPDDAVAALAQAARMLCDR
jgi:hypothetical protein